ncbi:MAG TPA: hypothetical protein VEV38_14170, partial [Candidatus Eremiobacteraceae bacterium]|nr:hypothetical protein [Candidatus Eremiobacteraceae bacterium]
MIAEPVQGGIKLVDGRPSDYDSHQTRARAFASKRFIVITAVRGGLESGMYHFVRIASIARPSDM